MITASHKAVDLQCYSASLSSTHGQKQTPADDANKVHAAKIASVVGFDRDRFPLPGQRLWVKAQ